MVLNDGNYQTVKIEDAETLSLENSAMKTVYENGEMLVDENLEEIRKRANEIFKA